MSGCYGNSSEDRHFERMCDNYTDQYYGEDLCGCEKTQTDEQNDNGLVEIDEVVYELGDTDDGYYTCQNCDYQFTNEDIKTENI
jgi:hypothetical protein